MNPTKTLSQKALDTINKIRIFHEPKYKNAGVFDMEGFEAIVSLIPYWLEETDKPMEWYENFLERDYQFHVYQWKKHIEAKRQLESDLYRDNEQKLWIMATIGYNDKSDIDIKKMQAYMEKIKKFDKFKYLIWAHEKHKEGKEGEIHHHTHILINIEKHEKPAHLKRYIGKVFKNTDHSSEDFVRIDYPQNGRCYNTWIKYIRGEKCEDKRPYVDKDRTWRHENNEPNLYEHTNN